MQTDRLYELRWIDDSDRKERLPCKNTINFIHIKKHLAFFNSIRDDFKLRNINIIPSLISEKVYTIEEKPGLIQWRYKYGDLIKDNSWNWVYKDSIYTFIRNRKDKTRR